MRAAASAFPAWSATSSEDRARLLNAIADRIETRADEFAAAEDEVLRRDWSAAARTFATFVEDLEAHFRAEEEVLFPAYESSTGMIGGPTQVMRMEHEQMRGLVRQMKEGLAARDGSAFGGSAETLLILMQQHNMKEENILYPMCDAQLGGENLPPVLAEKLGTRQAA